MTDRCIFCGKPILDSEKTDEHVIPQWLINQTGDPNRSVMFLPFVTDSTPEHLPFNNLCFPAHKNCNNEHTKLEDKAKRVINKVLNSTPVNANEINSLLKWFDKVRIGLWLGYNSKLTDDRRVEPHFYINQRINKQDRMLIIEKMPNFGKRVNFCGAESPVFKYMSSAFLLCINDYIFTNASTIGLCSHNLGFPSFENFKLDANGQLENPKPAPLRTKLKEPIIKYIQNHKDSIILYQPIFKETLDCYKEHDMSYVKEHSLDYKNGIGGIFIQYGFSTPMYLENACNITPNVISRTLPESVILVSKLQNNILLDSKRFTPITREEKDKIHKWIGLNNDYIKSLKINMLPIQISSSLKMRKNILTSFPSNKIS